MERQFFAHLDDNNVVIDVHCVTQEFLNANPDRYPGTWVETFFNTDGKTYAGIGYTYNDDTQDFEPPYVEPIEPIEPDDGEQ
jgi:hypothetical protein